MSNRNESKIITMDDMISEWLRSAWQTFVAIFIAAIGYFLPVKNIVHVLVLFFVADMVIGYLNAKMYKGERFSMSKIWRTTFPRLFLSLIIIVLAYLWDTVYQQDTVCTYRFIGWIISGVLFANIIKNGYYITKWDVFIEIGEFVSSRINFKKKNNENI